MTSSWEGRGISKDDMMTGGWGGHLCTAPKGRVKSIVEFLTRGEGG